MKCQLIPNRFAQENGLMFLETSAKTGHAVEEAFLKCSKNILAKIETGELDPERIGSGKSTGRLLTCIISKDQQNKQKSHFNQSHIKISLFTNCCSLCDREEPRFVKINIAC